MQTLTIVYKISVTNLEFTLVKFVPVLVLKVLKIASKNLLLMNEANIICF